MNPFTMFLIIGAIGALFVMIVIWQDTKRADRWSEQNARDAGLEEEK